MRIPAQDLGERKFKGFTSALRSGTICGAEGTIYGARDRTGVKPMQDKRLNLLYLSSPILVQDLKDIFISRIGPINEVGLCKVLLFSN